MVSSITVKFLFAALCFRVCCVNWFWCQDQMPPITSAPLPNPSYQFCQYHRFSQTCLSRGVIVTATQPPMVTRRCIFYCGMYDVKINTSSLRFLFMFWSQRNPGASGSGVGAVMFGGATGPAVVQSAQERTLPLRWYNLDRCARGWGLNQSNHPLLSTF